MLKLVLTVTHETGSLEEDIPSRFSEDPVSLPASPFETSFLRIISLNLSINQLLFISFTPISNEKKMLINLKVSNYPKIVIF
ncbi:hypothetical protein TNCV_1777171 [Trichonephila clavipes]|nr:hypothetical protein TNCV_1777171 [Trichonephila clavipes]